jgi:cytochrome c-type biogenesis protein CcmH/NrfG
VLLVGCAVASYANSLPGPFLYDDLPSIVANPTIRHLWPPGAALHPPAASTVTGRPLLNLSFAVSQALGGGDVRSYHVINILIHSLGGLALFGCIRRTLTRIGFAAGNAGAVLGVAWAAALIWLVHPLQTEAVTYVAQRAESLMGLLYLFTLYTFIRGIEAVPGRSRRLWLAGSVASCAAGMGVKEVMVTAPVMILLYDRTFGAGGLRAALRRRGGYYAGLAACWIPLGWWILEGGGNRNGSIGFGIGVSPWTYARTQLVAIPRYLGLSLWPHPLIFEYGPLPPPSASAAIAGGLFVGGLLLGTLIATAHRRPVGFLGVWFFGILAPTSSVVPGATQMIVEHRMYLPLAAVVVLAACGAFRLVDRLRRGAGGAVARGSTGAFLVPAIATAAVLVALTDRRNADYRSEVGLWRDTVAKRPRNPVAHDNLGASLLRAGQWPEAAAEFEAALHLRPDDPEAHNALGNLSVRQRRLPEAIGHFHAAVRLAPGYADAHFNLGLALAQSGEIAGAITELATVVRLQPEDAKAREVLAELQAADGSAPAPAGR